MMAHRVLVMAMLIFTLGLFKMAHAQDELTEEQFLQVLDRRAKAANEFVEISPILVAAPLGRWVLLRKEEALCALRFTAFRHERGDAKQVSWVWDSFFADYDWFYQGDGSQDLRKTNVRSGHGEASRKPNIWRIERGYMFVECGSIKAQWWYPSDIYLINRSKGTYDPKTSDQPNDIEIALTGWKNIHDVNAKDPRLIWHRYDTQRDPSHNNEPPTPIPVEKLPGFEIQ